MGWRDLLQTAPELIVAPWLGGRSLQSGSRSWTLEKLPVEHGWYCYRVKGRTAKLVGPSDPTDLLGISTGYLVGNWFVSDQIPQVSSLKDASLEEVYLIEPGLERFARVRVGRAWDRGPLIFSSLDMSVGPEDTVLDAYLTRACSVADIPGVTPALSMAFKVESWHREAVERRRAEEQARREREARREAARRSIGDSQLRRDLAKEDFGLAAKAALAVGGAEYLDHRTAVQDGDMLVRFRLSERRFECVCNATTLRIVDSGVCLKAEYDDEDFSPGTEGDSWLTLEALPGVLLEAIARDSLVVFRHV